jgi:tRNA uridine 5-carboxymethylaminomethyl modification enzyme
MEKWNKIREEVERLENTYVSPDERVNGYLESRGSAAVKTGVRLSELLRRPEITYKSLAAIDDGRPGYLAEIPENRYDAIAEQVEISIKYEGYIKRQLIQVEQFKKLEKRRLPEGLDYSGIHGLSLEARQKLAKIKPDSVGQASRISGVSPADISVLLVYLEQMNRKNGRQ